GARSLARDVQDIERMAFEGEIDGRAASDVRAGLQQPFHVMVADPLRHDAGAVDDAIIAEPERCVIDEPDRVSRRAATIVGASDLSLERRIEVAGGEPWLDAGGPEQVEEIAHHK